VPFDITRLTDALALDAPLEVGQQLCRRDAHAFAQLLGKAPEAIVGCTQESALLRELADEAGSASGVTFINLRDIAGRSARGGDVQPDDHQLGRPGRARRRQTSARQGRAEQRRTGRAEPAAPGESPAQDGARHPGKGYGLVRQKERCGFSELFELVMANQADFPVCTMCRVLRISASGFYAWSTRVPSPRRMANAVLTERIRAIHSASDATCGRPRVRAELLEQGERVSHKRIARLMRVAGLRGVSRRRGFTVTTRRGIRTAARRPIWSSGSSWRMRRTSCGWPT
jgi:hypothetical protein